MVRLVATSIDARSAPFSPGIEWDCRQVPWHFSGHGQHLRPPFGYGAGTTTPLFPIARESLFFSFLFGRRSWFHRRGRP